MTHEFRLDVPESPDVVFDWHRRPGALARMLPPWQPVRAVREAASLRDGVAVLRFPAGRTWVAQHVADEYDDGHRFADRLASRPFLLPLRWHHQHEFAAGPSGCTVTDRVTTGLPASLLTAMFRYRHRQLVDDLASHCLAASTPRLTVAVTGSSGLVGSAVVPFLTTGGHRVVRLVRRPPAREDERQWDPKAPDPATLADVDAVIHLAGASIAGRFTASHKREVRDSRVEPTRRLAQAAAASGVSVFVSASAIGFYGADRGDEELDEHASAGDGFLADLVRDWENAAIAGAGPAMRVVVVRTGIVQSPRGGALRLQRPLFAAGLGGPLGAGDQWVSWIGIDDLVDVYHRALIDPRLDGVVNAVAPHPVRQRDYAAALGRALHRPAIVPTPGLAPQLLLGSEGRREVASASQRVRPAALERVGHAFRFPQVEPALRHLLGSAPGVAA
ncbi:MAG TPA: TIGR01777 family oxidoreductase [Aeromicrobium sp.]|nr:TIGR01777 family oxidoreductase [Aeromicrobium sp.]HKY57588.1 TIGR01777 family oxidoreductase [Aeromicrobium sp.]